MEFYIFFDTEKLKASIKKNSFRHVSININVVFMTVGEKNLERSYGSALKCASITELRDENEHTSNEICERAYRSDGA